MSMQYNITFNNARILPERFGNVVGEPGKAVTAETVIDALNGLFSDNGNEPTVDDATGALVIDGCGLYESAGFSAGSELRRVLAECEPGAYIVDIDAEDGDGGINRTYVTADRTLRTIAPTMLWPNLPELAEPGDVGAVDYVALAEACAELTITAHDLGNDDDHEEIAESEPKVESLAWLLGGKLDYATGLRSLVRYAYEAGQRATLAAVNAARSEECDECEDTATNHWPNLTTPVQMCDSCTHDAYRSGWEPGA